MYSTSINSVLFLILDFNDPFAILFDQIGGGAVLVSFITFLITRRAWLLLIPTLYALALPICTTFLHSTFAYEYGLFTNAARIGLPLVLYLFYSRKAKWSLKIGLIMRFTLALTFVGHGIEALKSHPKFIDFLIKGADFTLGFSLTEERAIQLLLFIGSFDIILGIGGLLRPRVWIFSCMAFWGVVTALVRFMYFEWNGVFPMLLRSAHWALPVVVIWMILENKKNKQALGALKI